mmetsp:Transcript_45249/g.144015  ORF Transcript_45249/g.144015 Transcript_45249/m.144015 type:complete len:115 (+) Transcript_45249:93-437(+)
MNKKMVRTKSGKRINYFALGANAHKVAAKMKNLAGEAKGNAARMTRSMSKRSRDMMGRRVRASESEVDDMYDAMGAETGGRGSRRSSMGERMNGAGGRRRAKEPPPPPPPRRSR